MHSHLSPFPFSEMLYMLCFKNQFKNKKDEGGCNLPHFMQMRCGPQAPAKLLKSLPWAWEVRTQILSLRMERLCWTVLPQVDVGQVTGEQRLSMRSRPRASWAAAHCFPCLSLRTVRVPEASRIVTSLCCGCFGRPFSCLFQMQNV